MNAGARRKEIRQQRRSRERREAKERPSRWRFLLSLALSDRIKQITGHWLTLWLWVLIPAAFSFSGWRNSVMTQRTIFFICWLGCVYWSLTTPLGKSRPWRRVLFMFAFAFAFFMMAAWGKPAAIPQSFGTLIPRRKLLFSENGTGTSLMLEIGDSGTGLVWDGPPGKPMVELVKGSHLTIESIGEHPR
jgi:hypothetical protein